MAANATTLEQRREQRVLVLAVSILIVEHLARGMRLVAPDPERQAHVPDVLAHEGIEAPRPFIIGHGTSGDLDRLRPHLGSGGDLAALQRVIPARYFLPFL